MVRQAFDHPAAGVIPQALEHFDHGGALGAGHWFLWCGASGCKVVCGHLDGVANVAGNGIQSQARAGFINRQPRVICQAGLEVVSPLGHGEHDDFRPLKLHDNRVIPLLLLGQQLFPALHLPGGQPDFKRPGQVALQVGLEGAVN